MKAKEIRELSIEEMKRKRSELAEELFNLRFQHESDQLENPRRIQETKRDIARCNTIIHENEKAENISKQ